MTDRRNVTRRNSPSIFLSFGIFLAFFAFAFPLAVRHDFVNETELMPISGTVQRAYGQTGKVHNFNITLLTAGGVHHLTQEDLSAWVPGLRTLQVGDTVTARVRHDILGRDLDWYWELQRNGVTILTYGETERFYLRESKIATALSHWLSGLSLILLICAVLLRKHFGAWRPARA